LTGVYCRPYSEFSIPLEFHIIIHVAKNHIRPTIPKECPESLSKLVTAMWASEPNSRPAATDLVRLLREVEKEYQDNQQTWDALKGKSEPIKVATSSSSQTDLFTFDSPTVRRAQSVDQSPSKESEQ
jgi:hypothetical protein